LICLNELELNVIKKGQSMSMETQDIVKCLYYATTGKLQARKECCSHNRLCASVNPALSLKVQHFSEDKKTKNVKMMLCCTSQGVKQKT